jgi:hypothetical protein
MKPPVFKLRQQLLPVSVEPDIPILNTAANTKEERPILV